MRNPMNADENNATTFRSSGVLARRPVAVRLQSDLSRFALPAIQLTVQRAAFEIPAHTFKTCLV